MRAIFFSETPYPLICLYVHYITLCRKIQATENKRLIFLTLSAPADKLLGLCGVLAAAYLADKAAEHIGKISCYEFCAVDIIRADVALVEPQTGRARRKFVIAENVPAIRVMLTAPIITYHILLHLKLFIVVTLT